MQSLFARLLWGLRAPAGAANGEGAAATAPPRAQRPRPPPAWPPCLLLASFPPERPPRLPAHLPPCLFPSCVASLRAGAGWARAFPQARRLGEKRGAASKEAAALLLRLQSEGFKVSFTLSRL